MIGKLIINGYELPIIKEIPVSTNYAVADIKDPDKRGGSTTKTIIIPMGGDADIVFDSIYDVNIEQTSFNPNVKINATYYLNELEQFEGDCQLLKFSSVNGYECSIVGREAGIFVAVADALLTDLDFSDLDHTFNKTEQKNSWDTSYMKSGVPTPFSYGEGYVYPFINYGYTGSNSVFDVNYFKPAIPLREYLLRIYQAQGFTWNTGGFLDSSLIRHLYVPCNRDKIELSNADISNSQYYIGKTAASVLGWLSGTSNVSGNLIHTNQIIYPEYDLETGTYFDASNQYDETVSFTSTILNSGIYNIVALAQMDVTVNAPSLVGGSWTSALSLFDCYIEKWNGTSWSIVAAIGESQPATTQNLGTAKSYRTSAQTGNIALLTGDQIRVRTRISVSATTKDSLGTPTSAAYTIDYTLPNGATKNAHYLLRTDTSVYDGNTMTMNNSIPLNIKQKDLLKSVINIFNIYSEKDKDLPNNYIQEPRDSFYTNNVDDWTAKLDYLKPWESYPMKELDAVNYIWKYKDDKDYYNDLYQKQYIDNYGLKRHQVASDFIKGEKKTEVIFSPTPLVSNSSNNIICPHIYAKDGASIKPVTHNIRLLYYGGLKSSGNAWSYTSAVSGTSSETQYPYIGHVDDPLAPTIDLNFDYPNEVYYTYPLAYYTTNNLYNAYYSKFINEITDRDSKIIVCYIRLDEVDIKNFSFRNKVFIRHDIYGAGYYVVNKIIDYDPLTAETTKVELLKLKNYSAFSPATIAIDIGSETSEVARIKYNPVVNAYANTETDNTIAVGSRNIVKGAGNTVTGGEDNFIDETSAKITLLNCKGCSVIGATNFTGIGLTNEVIDDTYNDKVKVGVLATFDGTGVTI